MTTCVVLQNVHEEKKNINGMTAPSQQRNIPLVVAATFSITYIAK